MTISKFTAAEKIKLVNEAKDTSISYIAKKNGINKATLYGWVKKFSKVAPSETPKENRNVLGLLAAKEKEIIFLKSEIEKRDRIILHYALKYCGGNG